jgi:hypothetical protein
MMFTMAGVQSIIQNNIQLVFPLWFEEGLAEYLALGWDTQTDMFMRDAVLNNYLPPIPAAWRIFCIPRRTGFLVLYCRSIWPA